MIVVVGIWRPHPQGGWWESASGHMSVFAHGEITARVAQRSLKAFLHNVYAPSVVDDESRFEPDKTIAGATFGELGTIFVDGNGVAKEMTPFGQANGFGEFCEVA